MMKKMICALVACAMLLCAACAFAAPNPMVESSYSEILTKLGLGILAPGAAQEAQWFIIDDDLAQVGFSIYEIPYTLRAKAASAAEDISGMYFSSGDETKVNILWNEGSYRAEDGVGARVMWYDAQNGVAYSLSCEDAGIEKDTLVEYAADAYRYCAKGAIVTLAGTQSADEYTWAAINYDPSKLTISAPVYEAGEEGGQYTFAVAGVQADTTDTLTLVYYRTEAGLDSAVEMRNCTVTVDSEYNVTLTEDAVG